MLSNSKLKNCFKLSSKITVYVPATMHDKKVNNKKQVDEVASLLSASFGGATSTNARGYWMSTEKGLIKESTTVVYAYCDTTSLEKHIDEVVEMCEKIKAEMQQEAVALEINGEIYFI
jgi:hypothetical protein